MSLETILVAIDFSEQSEAALDQAIGMAERLGSALVLLSVEVAAAPNAAVSTTGAAGVAAQLNQHLDTATQLQALAERAAGRVRQVSHRVANGHPDEVITEIAEQMHADLIVTGTKGRTGFQHFLLGSVAEKVVRMSTTNVLVARGNDAGFRRILVPTDFSPASEKALQLAATVAGAKAEIDLLYAWQYPSGTRGATTSNPTSGPLAAIRDQIVKEGTQAGVALGQRYSTTDLVIHFVHDYGPPAATIQERLKEHDYDLVAMGTHGYRGFRRFLLGSVAEATVRHAPCSVIVAHAGDVADAGNPR